MNNVAQLQKAIRDLHSCDTTHVQSVPVYEACDGKVIWDGDVEVFLLKNHPRAKRAYAWNYRDDFGKSRHIEVLGVPPVNSAADAVRAAFVVESEKQK
jgi:hypothetical protein